MKIYLPTYQTTTNIPQDYKTQVENGRCVSWNRLSVYKVDNEYCVASFDLLERILHVLLQVFGKDYLGDKIRNELKKGNVTYVDPAELSNIAPTVTPAPALSVKEQEEFEKIKADLRKKKEGEVLKVYLGNLEFVKREDALDYHTLTGTFNSWAKIPNFLLIRSSFVDAIQGNLKPSFWRTEKLIRREREGKDLLQSLTSKNLFKEAKELAFLREICLVKWPQQVNNEAVLLGCGGSPNELECVMNELLYQKAVHSWGWGRGRENIVIKFHESDQFQQTNIEVHFRTLEAQLTEEKFKRENKITLDEKQLQTLPEAKQKDLRFVVRLLNERIKHGVKELSGIAYKPVAEWLKQHGYIHDFKESGITFRIFVKSQDVAREKL